MSDLTKPIAQWISNNIPLSVGILIFLFCLFFEISKIKVYPLRWLWKLITFPYRKIEESKTNAFKKLLDELKANIDNKFTEMGNESKSNCTEVKRCLADLEKRFDKMDTKQKESEERLDMLAAARIKNHVLNFARQCRKGEPHSHEDFANLFAENMEYEKLVKKYDWSNDVYKHDFEYIKRMYDQHNNHGDFTDDLPSML